MLPLITTVLDRIPERAILQAPTKTTDHSLELCNDICKTSTEGNSNAGQSEIVCSALSNHLSFLVSQTCYHGL
jgi:hypothetical protein